MPQDLMTRYATVADLERRARRRMPHFAWEYLASGTGADLAVQRNRDALDAITFTPRFMQGEFAPQLRTELFGQTYEAPIGVAPVGLTGLMWPRAERILARAAARFGVPYGLSTVATESPETIGPLAAGMGWFQLYPPRDLAVRDDLLRRAREAGFKVLMITVDVPVGSRRERQRRAGVSVPPRITPRMLWHCALRPAWSLATLSYDIPRFRGIEPYANSRDLQRVAGYIGAQFGGTLDWDYVKQVRDRWEGPLLLKGVMHGDDALRGVQELGCDGVVVSNHGARQFDGVAAAIDVLPQVVAALAGRGRVVFDSGVRSGVDVCRAIALGADFVLAGRAFMYGVAALGDAGGEQVMRILIEDLRNAMAQLGCRHLEDLRERLSRSPHMSR